MSGPLAVGELLQSLQNDYKTSHTWYWPLRFIYTRAKATSLQMGSCRMLLVATGRKRSSGQGNVFTGVCLSTGGGSAQWGMPRERGVCLGGSVQGGGLHPGMGGLHPGRGVCIQGGGSASREGGSASREGTSASRKVCIRGCLHPRRGGGQTPLPGIRSTSGRYTSYWIAFLFTIGSDKDQWKKYFRFHSNLKELLFYI